MIAIEFASEDDACLVLQALPTPARATAYFRPAIAAVPPSDDDPGQEASSPCVFVEPEFEAAAEALAADLPGARKATLIAYAADVRWRREVGGITVGGVPVATDDRAKMMIVGARLAAIADPQWSTVWHGADGQTYPVEATAMLAISDAVQAHVNSCFATFALVMAAIDAGSITTMAQIDAADWPAISGAHAMLPS
jgi:hypothetical protein